MPTLAGIFPLATQLLLRKEEKKRKILVAVTVVA
jgi:hypothetical protein